jgi:hypothetical protein
MYSPWDDGGLYSQPICTHHEMTALYSQPICTHHEIPVECILNQYVLTMRWWWTVFSTNMYSPWDDGGLYSQPICTHHEMTGLYSPPICTHHEMTALFSQPICTHHDMTVDCSLNQYVLTMRWQWIVFSTNMYSSWDDCIVFSTNMYSPWDDSGLLSQPICTHHEMTVGCILKQYVLTMRWLWIVFSKICILMLSIICCTLMLK